MIPVSRLSRDDVIERAEAMHHDMGPWLPADIIQRRWYVPDPQFTATCHVCGARGWWCERQGGAGRAVVETCDEVLTSSWHLP